MKKLLHITFETKAMDDALAKEFNYLRIVFPQIPKENIDTYICNVFKDFNPDIVLKEDVGSLDLKESTLKTLSKAFMVQWTQDIVIPYRKPILEYAKYGLSLFSNYINIEKLKDAGYKADFLMSSEDYDLYAPIKGVAKRGIVFIANNYDTGVNMPIRKSREDMVDFLREEYPNDFSLYGNNWFHRGSKGYVGFKNEAKVYSEALMAINISQFNTQRYTSNRMYKILGCKTFCLSHAYPGCEVDFPDVETFNSFEELKYTIDYFLKPENRAELDNIADKTHKHALKYHSWDARVQQLKSLIDKWS